MTFRELLKEIWLVIETHFVVFWRIRNIRNIALKEVTRNPNLTKPEKLVRINAIFRQEKELRDVAVERLKEFFKERYK